MTRTVVAALRRGQRWMRLDRLARRAVRRFGGPHRTPRLDGLGERALTDIGLARWSGRAGDRYRPRG